MSGWPFKRTPPPGSLGGDQDADIDEELEFHLELRTRELMDEGLDRDTARREAEMQFGDAREVARRIKRERRRGGAGRMMMNVLGELRGDLGYAFRTFRRNPGFAGIAALTLAVAIAGNTAVFSVLDSAILRALPFENASELVFLNGYHLQNGERAIRYASVPEFTDWRERSRGVSSMAGVRPAGVTLRGGGGAERAEAEVVSQDYFSILGGTTPLGRTFTPEEYEVPDAHPVVVLSHSLWVRSFGSDPGVVGRSVLVNERTVEVIGVMAADFAGVSLDVDLWIPMGMMSLVGSADLLDTRGTRFLPVIGRLASGVSVEDAQRELDAIAGDLQDLYPDINRDRFVEVETFRDGYLGSTGRLLWVLFGAGGFLLLIAAANVANLLLVRADARVRELTVRRAVGADSGRVARLLLTESIALAAIGGAFGLVLAAWGLRVLTPLIPHGVLPGYAEPVLSVRAFLFALVSLTVVGVLAGLAPALSSARRDLTTSLRAGGRGMTGGRARTQQIFVITQVGLALLLLVGAGLLTRSFRAQLAVDPGLEMDGVHVFSVQPSRESVPDADGLRVFTDELLRTVAEVPGVRSVAASSDFPLRGGSSGAYVFRPDDPETRIRYHRHSVSPGYFENLGVELRSGRFIEASDNQQARPVAVVTQAFVERVLPDASNGVGRSIYVGDPSDPANLAEIVGVVENIRYRNLTQDMMEESNSPDVFFSIHQVPARFLEISFRTDAGVAPNPEAIRTAVQRMDPSIPAPSLTTLEELYHAQTATPRFAAFLMGLFSGLALLLACVGIYGVLSHSVGRRGPEIALRRALGAQAADVARSVVWDGARLAGVGLVIGGIGALLSGRVLESLLFNVESTDPMTFAVVASALLLVATLAAAVPAWHASRKAPADVLGGE